LVVAVRNVVLMDGFAKLFGTVNVAGYFDGLFNFVFDAIGIILRAELHGGIIAIFLECVDVAGEAADRGDRTGEFVGLSGELLLGFRFEEELGEVRGGSLKADLGELIGVNLAEMFEQVVLENAAFDGAVLFGAPFSVAAAGFPVGDVTFGDANAVFFKLRTIRKRKRRIPACLAGGRRGPRSRGARGREGRGANRRCSK
jgi:hypothetical protein